jgi:Ca2+-binding EF-hand superfamily protein
MFESYRGNLSFFATTTEEQMDWREQEVRDRLAALVKNQFNGDAQAAFAHYDRDGDGKISRDHLCLLCEDAGIGNRFTRGRWVDGIMEKVDKDGDGFISKAELSL